MTDIQNAGPVILEHALNDLFPIADDVDPKLVEGKLTGYAEALDAVGFDYSPLKKETNV